MRGTGDPGPDWHASQKGIELRERRLPGLPGVLFFGLVAIRATTGTLVGEVVGHDTI
jgi:hypothetical protein